MLQLQESYIVVQSGATVGRWQQYLSHIAGIAHIPQIGDPAANHEVGRLTLFQAVGGGQDATGSDQRSAALEVATPPDVDHVRLIPHITRMTAHNARTPS